MFTLWTLCAVCLYKIGRLSDGKIDCQAVFTTLALFYASVQFTHTTSGVQLKQTIIGRFCNTTQLKNTNANVTTAFPCDVG